MSAARAKLDQRFFGRDAVRVARGLIGKILVHRVDDNQLLRARIVETEAYLGPDDLASHASKGLTNRTRVMFGTPGRAYVYFIYGMHEMFNIICGREGTAHAVLVRAGEPLDGWEANLSGPGRFAREMRVTRADNGLDLTGEKLFVLEDSSYRAKVGRATRVGIDYAEHWKDAPLRFYDLRSDAVSRPRPSLVTVPKSLPTSVAKTQATSRAVRGRGRVSASARGSGGSRRGDRSPSPPPA